MKTAKKVCVSSLIGFVMAAGAGVGIFCTTLGMCALLVLGAD